MLAELVALALVAGLVGVAAGYLIAAALLPDVAASLRGLYGARMPGSLGLGPGWWAAGIAMSLPAPWPRRREPLARLAAAAARAGAAARPGARRSGAPGGAARRSPPPSPSARRPPSSSAAASRRGSR